jgi:hypothetical protein
VHAQVFVFTCGAGGVGITLTAAATIVLVDRALTPVSSHADLDNISSGSVCPVCPPLTQLFFFSAG